MTYTYIVESKNDMPVCDSISKENLGPFYVVNERTNSRCLGTRWEDDFSESCNHVIKNTAVTINDTLYICKYNSWQVADISDARESCTAANDSTTMLFNGERYACEDGSWRAFTEIENKLGYCRGNLIGSFEDVKTVVDTLVKKQEYYCDTDGWRRSVMTDHVGFCDSSKVFETVKYMGSSYVCRRNQWESFSSLENEIGVCSPKKNKLITDDIKKLVSSACKDNVKLEKYKLEHYNRFRIGSVSILKMGDEKPILYLGETFTTEYQKLWNNDVGKVLIKELRKKDPDLYEIKTNTFRALLKKIGDDELSDHEEKKLVHLTIGDSKYTIIKAVSNKKVYAEFTDDYDFEWDEDDDVDDSKQYIDLDEITNQEEEDNNAYALF
jgi:hypothetical protein